MKIQESAENYLETIHVLKNRLGQVRSIDIVNELNYSKPSVSVAVRQLKENGYIQIDEGGYITLIGKGLEIAERIYERHLLLSEWLMAIGVGEQTAKADACKLEHNLSEESFEKLKVFWNKCLKSGEFTEN